MAPSDAAIIQAVLSGEVDRYAELVERYQEPAIRLAYSLLGNQHDAEDVAQIAFVKAYQHLKDFHGQSKFSTWLHRIVVNECKDFHKRASRRPKAAALPADDEESEGGGIFELPDPGGDPRADAANRELATRMSEAIAQLPLPQRTAFVLHHVQGLPLEEVAQTMRCPLGTAKWYVFRANAFLQRQLEPWVKAKGLQP